MDLSSSRIWQCAHLAQYRALSWDYYARIMASGAHFFLVTNQQLYLAIGIPMLFNAALIGIVATLFSTYLKARFDAVDKRFDDMRDLWRAELRRVEEVLDARLKHIEQRP